MIEWLLLIAMVMGFFYALITCLSLIGLGIIALYESLTYEEE